MNPFFFKFIYNFFFIKEPWNVLVLDKIKTSQPGRSLSINTKTTSMSEYNLNQHSLNLSILKADSLQTCQIRKNL